MKPLIQDPNDQNTLSKTIVLSSRFFLCVQSTTVLWFDLFIASNLDNFSKYFSVNQKDSQ
jgi:hypothetical protein